MFQVLTKFPVAFDSPDTYEAHGGPVLDNSREKKFNAKLYELFEAKGAINNKFQRILWIMDLGCSGGGFVKDCIDDGHLAIGLEGCDYSYNVGRAEWSTIPNNLFKCDISRPFTVLYDYEQVKFDVITLWEVFEHLLPSQLTVLLKNIDAHLSKEGIVIGSVSTAKGPPHHQTVKEKSWWMNFFKDRGFHNDESLVSYFGNDTVRGPTHRAQDSFIVVLKSDKIKRPTPDL